MGIRLKTFSGLACATMLIVSTSSYASTCYTENFAGIWTLSGSSGNFTEWDLCKLKLRSTGKIVSKSSSCTTISYLNVGKVNIAGGSFDYFKNCTYEVRIKFCSDGYCEWFTVIGRLDKGKTMQIGGGANDFEDVIIEYTGVKW